MVLPYFNGSAHLIASNFPVDFGDPQNVFTADGQPILNVTPM